MLLALFPSIGNRLSPEFQKPGFLKVERGLSSACFRFVLSTFSGVFMMFHKSRSSWKVLENSSITGTNYMIIKRRWRIQHESLQGFLTKMWHLSVQHLVREAVQGKTPYCFIRTTRCKKRLPQTIFACAVHLQTTARVPFLHWTYQYLKCCIAQRVMAGWL